VSKDSITQDHTPEPRERRWHKVGGAKPSTHGTFCRFDAPGQRLEGTWLGWRPGPFGDVGALETSTGIKTFSPSTVLRDQLADVEEGSLVRIVCEGKRTSKAGREYKAFTVMVAEGGAT
jgi:hypothetical protein